MSESSNSVVLFPGCRVKYLEPEVGKATIQVLGKNGLRPRFMEQKCCAVPKLACGDKQGFLKYAAFNIRSLNKTSDDIVTDCTSCALALKRDYPEILKDEESEKVSRRTFDVMEYLVRLNSLNRLNTAFQFVDSYIYYHAPCHLRALGMEMVHQRIRLLQSIPGLVLVSSPNGWCCGMGGTFGFKKNNYDMSMAIGRTLFDAIKQASPALIATECSMCKTQLEQGTGLRVIHPVEIVKQAYGI